MRVRIALTLDVDVEGWASEYGIDPADVRADVRVWARERLQRYDDELARVIS